MDRTELVIIDNQYDWARNKKGKIWGNDSLVYEVNSLDS